MQKIIINQVFKSFQDQPVLNGISLSANQGDVVALMGSSGSGKSTLLRCMNLLITPDKGNMVIDGQPFHFDGQKNATLNPKQVAALRQKIGIVFQQFNLWSHMTILQNLIEAPIRVQKRNKKEAIEEAEQLLDQVGLIKQIHRYPAHLSGGQQQRAAIARALMMHPEIMLFDEPTSALDPEMVGEVLAVLRDLADKGMTMMIATHEISFARRVASHAVFLEGGKIIESGETNRLFLKPETERLRQFLAAMTVMDVA